MYIVIDKQKIIDNDQLINTAVLLWKNEDTLEESSQYVLRMNSDNESSFRNHVKYSANDISTARSTQTNLPETIDQPLLNQPFSAKILPNGKKLYKRVHGASIAIDNETKYIDLIVPYSACKVTGVEFLNGNFGDSANLLVLDSSTGTYTTVSHYTLNQFGFDVNIGKGYHKETSSYDADLYYGMVLRIEYTTSETKTIYANFVLHEVK